MGGGWARSGVRAGAVCVDRVSVDRLEEHRWLEHVGWAKRCTRGEACRSSSVSEAKRKLGYRETGRLAPIACMAVERCSSLNPSSRSECHRACRELRVELRTKAS